MYIRDFYYHRPQSLQEALALLNKSENGAPLAGGTDLLVEIKRGVRTHKDIISLSSIDGLNSIFEDERNIYIGATATHNEVIKSPVIRKYYPVISIALSQIGSEQVRNSGTTGGNLCTGASCCDSAPILIALDARVEIASSKNSKTVPLKDFFVFNKKTILQKGELLTKIIIPKPVAGLGAHFEKFGLRDASAISVASVAVSVRLPKGICENACVVMGAVAPVPKISDMAGHLLIGKTAAELSGNSTVPDQAAEAAAGDSVPIDDIRGGALYRKELVRVLTRRTIVKAVGEAVKSKR